MQLKKKSDAREIDRKILLVVVPERKLILPAIKTTSNAKQEASQDNIFTVKLEKYKPQNESDEKHSLLLSTQRAIKRAAAKSNENSSHRLHRKFESSPS
jgi:hypothetical protein